MLVTWVGPLNLSKVCAIFSVSMVPQPCPAHSLQFVRFRHISALEIPPHTTRAPVVAGPTSSTRGSLTDCWLAEAFWAIMKSSAKHCKPAKTRPRGPCLLTRLPQVATETNFHRENEPSRDVPLSCSKQSETAAIHCVATAATLCQYKEDYLVCGSWLVTWTAVMIMLLMQVFLNICSPHPRLKRIHFSPDAVCKQLWKFGNQPDLLVNAINQVSGCVCIYVSMVIDADPLGHVDRLISWRGISQIISDTSKHFCHISSATGYSSMGVEAITSLTVLRSNSISGRWGVTHTPCAGRANKQKSSKHLEGVSRHGSHHQATGDMLLRKIVCKIHHLVKTFFVLNWTSEPWDVAVCLF